MIALCEPKTICGPCPEPPPPVIPPCIGFSAIAQVIVTIAPQNVITLMAFDTEEFDHGNFYDPTVGNFNWTPPAGLITVGGAVVYTTQPTGIVSMNSIIFKNNNPFKYGNRNAEQVNQFNRSIVSIVDEANGSDFYDLRIFHNGPAQQVTPLAGDTGSQIYFWGACLGVVCGEE